MEDSGCNSLLYGRGVGRLGFRICVPSYVRWTVCPRELSGHFPNAEP